MRNDQKLQVDKLLYSKIILENKQATLLFDHLRELLVSQGFDIAKEFLNKHDQTKDLRDSIKQALMSESLKGMMDRHPLRTLTAGIVLAIVLATMMALLTALVASSPLVILSMLFITVVTISTYAFLINHLNDKTTAIAKDYLPPQSSPSSSSPLPPFQSDTTTLSRREASMRQDMTRQITYGF